MTSKATKTFRQFLQGTTLSQEEWEEEVYGPEQIDEYLKKLTANGQSFQRRLVVL
jgi:hypothetical protein